MSSRQAALSLYRRSLKLALDWAVQRHLWRGQAIYIRSLFEANKNITDPRQQRALLKETEKLLDTWKHPDPYIHPTAPGGSKYERNLPVHPAAREPPHLSNTRLGLDNGKRVLYIEWSKSECGAIRRDISCILLLSCSDCDHMTSLFSVDEVLFWRYGAPQQRCTK